MGVRPLVCDCHCCILPQRYLMSFFGFMAIVLLFNMRVVLNLVINEMIPKKNKTSSGDDYCEEREQKKNRTALMDKQNWSEMEQSFLRAAFYLGYVPAHIPAGIAADILGARPILIASVFVSSVFTLIIPLLIKWTDGNAILVGVCRILVGIGQGLAIPSISSLLVKWVPKKERAFLGSFAMSGSHVGSIFGQASSGLIIGWCNNTWSAPFYFHGCTGLVFLIPLFIWVWTEPKDSPFVLEPERTMLANEIKPKEKRKMPFKAIFFDRVIWAMTIGQFAHMWVFFTFNTDLPKYLAQVLRYNIRDNGFISALPFLGMWISSILSGLFSDWLFVKRQVKILTLRRWFTVFGNIVPGILCVAAGYSGCNVYLAVVFLTLTLTAKGPFYCGIKVNYLDVTSNFGGIVVGLNNGLSAIAGFISPYTISIIAKDQTLGQWKIYFWVCLAVSTLPTLVYFFMTGAERRWWDYGENEEIPPEILPASRRKQEGEGFK